MNYHIIPTDEWKTPAQRAEMIEPQQKSWRRRRCVALALFFVVAFGLAVSFTTYNYRHTDAAFPPAEACGASPSEAIALSCSFDVMSFAWLPARCFDQALMVDFLALRPWQWYLDADGHQAVDAADVVGGVYDQLYVTQEYHMYHCTYMWRKMHRAVRDGKPLDGYIGSMKHTEHCERMLVNPKSPMNVTNTSILSKYVKCPFGGQDLERGGWYRIIDGVKIDGFGFH